MYATHSLYIYTHELVFPRFMRLNRITNYLTDLHNMQSMYPIYCLNSFGSKTGMVSNLYVILVNY